MRVIQIETPHRSGQDKAAVFATHVLKSTVNHSLKSLRLNTVFLSTFCVVLVWARLLWSETRPTRFKAKTFGRWKRMPMMVLPRHAKH